MPNWCLTDIKIKCDDGAKLKEFYSKLGEWTSHNYCDNGFGLNWLGNIVGNSGIGTIDTNTETDLRCRGFINDLDLEENQIFISVETAWSPMLKMWVKLMDKYLPDAEIVYASEECGCEIYVTNDPVQVGCWLVDDPNNDFYEFLDSNDAVKYLQKVLNSSEDDMNSLMRIARDNDYEVYAHQYEYVDINEWD